MTKLASIYTERMSANLNAWLDCEGTTGHLRRRSTEEDRYGDREEEWTEVKPISFVLRLATEGSVVGEEYNIFTEEGLPTRGYFKTTDDVQVGDVVELDYPLNINGKIRKYLEIVKLLHNYGSLITYELGTYKGEFDHF